MVDGENNIRKLVKGLNPKLNDGEYVFTTAIDPDDGQIILTMNNTLTSTIPAGRYYYDIVIVDITDGYRSRVIQGMATVTPGVTLST